MVMTQPPKLVTRRIVHGKFPYKQTTSKDLQGNNIILITFTSSYEPCTFFHKLMYTNYRFLQICCLKNLFASAGFQCWIFGNIYTKKCDCVDTFNLHHKNVTDKLIFHAVFCIFIKIMYWLPIPSWCPSHDKSRISPWHNMFKQRHWHLATVAINKKV